MTPDYALAGVLSSSRFSAQSSSILLAASVSHSGLSIVAPNLFMMSSLTVLRSFTRIGLATSVLNFVSAEPSLLLRHHPHSSSFSSVASVSQPDLMLSVLDLLMLGSLLFSQSHAHTRLPISSLSSTNTSSSLLLQIFI